MLQMWPWKMSLLLEGNNNSKFQLLLTLQSSVFPSERIRLGGESEHVSSDYSLLTPLSPHSPCSPHPPCPLRSTSDPHPSPTHPWGGWGDKEEPAQLPFG